MGSIPQEAPASVKQGEGHDARAPVKNVKVVQAADLPPGHILAKINWTGEDVVPRLLANKRSLMDGEQVSVLVTRAYFMMMFVRETLPLSRSH